MLARPKLVDRSSLLDDNSVGDAKRLIKPLRQKTSDHGARDRCEPEQPKLRHMCAARKQRRACATSGVHRRVRDRDRNEMDEDEREADRDACESRRSTFGRGADDDK